DKVDADVGAVAGEQTVLERGPAEVQQVEAGAGRLRTVVTEDAIAEQDRLPRLDEVLDRDPAAARARVVAAHLDPFDGGERSRISLDAAAVGVKEQRLAQVVGFDRRLLARSGGEVLGARDPEAAQD